MDQEWKMFASTGDPTDYLEFKVAQSLKKDNASENYQSKRAGATRI